jgi:hypothetical protein
MQHGQIHGFVSESEFELRSYRILGRIALGILFDDVDPSPEGSTGSGNDLRLDSRRRNAESELSHQRSQANRFRAGQVHEILLNGLKIFALSNSCDKFLSHPKLLPWLLPSEPIRNLILCVKNLV